MESNFDRFVMGQTMGKFGVISPRLWLEYLLSQCLRVVVPNPEPLFRERGIGFLQSVALCEAHHVIDKPLAGLLRKLNALRNKSAHQLAFNPQEQDWRSLTAAIQQVAPVGDSDEDDEPLRRLSDLLEQRALAIGAIDSDPVNKAVKSIRD